MAGKSATGLRLSTPEVILTPGSTPRRGVLAFIYFPKYAPESPEGERIAELAAALVAKFGSEMTDDRLDGQLLGFNVTRPDRESEKADGVATTFTDLNYVIKAALHAGDAVIRVVDLSAAEIAGHIVGEIFTHDDDRSERFTAEIDLSEFPSAKVAWIDFGPDVEGPADAWAENRVAFVRDVLALGPDTSPAP